MNQPVLSSRSTSGANLLSGFLSLGIDFVVFFWLGSLADKMEESWKFSEAEDTRTMAIILLGVGLVYFVYNVMQSKTYADVYPDRICGKGLQNFMLKEYDLRFDQIVEISQSKGFLNCGTGSGVYLVVTTMGGKYNILTKPACAKEIMEYFQSHR